ncbi:MAG: hypothetical protein P4N60_11425 [Verrucomicrobiae bacterium]|nr:hypothetical protein [Verrucomicrobiae bacterium]
MKTPREILLAQHRAAEAKLDAIRRSVVNELNHQGTKEQGSSPALVAWLLGGSKACWQELFFPSRRFWTGTAAIWIIILIINFSQRDEVDSVTGRAVHSSGPVMSLQAQQRWMNELFADRALPPEADRPRNFSPKPRTATTATVTV